MANNRYRTGVDDIDEAIDALVERIGRPEDRDLLFEMLVSPIRMAREDFDRGELKLVNAALKEMRYAFGLFEPYHHLPKVTIFGSARTQVADPAYACARDFGAAMAAEGWMIMTGAGPGIMEAGIHGAEAENSFGINIVLPFEADAAPVIASDPKLINFRYFFTRKLTFMKESSGFALLPGGFGTMDECFELLTLMQTGKSAMMPVVLLDPPGSTYWETFLDFIDVELRATGMISAPDLALVKITDDVEVAVDEICGFYCNYHSSRYVGQRLVLRLQQPPTADLVAQLNDDFGDIITKGRIEPIDATDSEIADDDHVDLHRLAFHFNRHGFSRLRPLIDRINGR